MCECEKSAIAQVFWACLFGAVVWCALTLAKDFVDLLNNERPKLRLECVVAERVTAAGAPTFNEYTLANQDLDAVIEGIECHSVGAIPGELR